MRARTTGILLLATVLLGLFIFGVERLGPGSEERARRERQVLRFKADRAEAFEIESGELLIRGERRGEAWRLTHPVDAPGDTAAIERMLAGFESMGRQAVIPRTERVRLGLGLDAYGLDRPRARWSLAESGERHVLWLGQPSAVGDIVYVFDEATEDVLAVSGRVRELLPASADALRERRLFRADPGRVYRMELSRPEGFLQLVRTEPGHWRIQQPLASRADAGAARGLAALLLDVRAESFVREGAGEDAPFGFDETGVSAVLLVEGEDSTFRVELGFPVPDRPGERYARVAGRPGIVSVSDGVYRQIRTGLDELRDRQLLPFGPGQVQGITLTVRGVRLALARGAGGAWQMSSPVQAPVDPGVVDGFLRLWTGTRVERFLPAGEPGDGSDEERMIAFRIEEEGERRVILVIEPPDRDGLIPIRFGDSGERVAIHPLRLRGFSVDPLPFVSRRPLVLDPAHVRGFSVRHLAQEWSVAVDASGQLSLGRAGEAPPIDAVTVRTQLALLLGLPVLGAVSWGEEGIDGQGLVDPDTFIRIHLSEEAGLGRTLALGRRGAEGVYVRIGGTDITYAVDASVAETLRRRPVAGDRD